MKAPYKTHAGMEMIIAEDDCDGYGEAYAVFLKKRYPSLRVTFIPRQSGGSGLIERDGTSSEYQNWYWELFCNS